LHTIGVNQKAFDPVMVSMVKSFILGQRLNQEMTNEVFGINRLVDEGAITERFLNAPCEETFDGLFRTFSPQLVAFFRARGCIQMAEDLAQEVMFTVYRKAEQIRDRALFRGWMFKIARNALCRYYGKQTRELETVGLAEVPDRLVAANNKGTTAFEFHHWMSFLDSRESETLTLRFIEEWEYHEIATAQKTPIGTVQWRVFSAKKKLASYLKRAEGTDHLARNAA
jgi:RNA polymerase sigma-70 factor (ECF subfamily)